MSVSTIATTFAPGDALLLVDLQNDFCPGGSLPVAHGERVMPVLNDWAAAAQRAGLPIFVSRDWHPQRTTHFKEFGGVWPPHCVSGTHGAEFHPEFRLPSNAIIVSKGMGEAEDAYSAFQGRDERGIELAPLLEQKSVRHLYVGGLATDYCVRSTTLEALASGYAVTLIPNGTLPVDVQAGDGEKAVEEMRAAGAKA